jgi:hypothetical protein
LGLTGLLFPYRTSVTHGHRAQSDAQSYNGRKAVLMTSNRKEACASRARSCATNCSLEILQACVPGLFATKANLQRVVETRDELLRYWGRGAHAFEESDYACFAARSLAEQGNRDYLISSHIMTQL